MLLQSLARCVWRENGAKVPLQSEVTMVKMGMDVKHETNLFCTANPRNVLIVLLCVHNAACWSSKLLNQSHRWTVHTTVTLSKQQCVLSWANSAVFIRFKKERKFVALLQMHSTFGAHVTAFWSNFSTFALWLQVSTVVELGEQSRSADTVDVYLMVHTCMCTDNAWQIRRILVVLKPMPGQEKMVSGKTTWVVFPERFSFCCECFMGAGKCWHRPH